MTVQSPKGPHVAWPSWRYGPAGEAEIFQNAGEVPDGWKDHPKKHLPGYVEPAPAPGEEAAAPAKPKRTFPMTTDAMCAQLFLSRIPFEDGADDEVLWALVQAEKALLAAAERATNELIRSADLELDAREAALVARETALGAKTE